MTATHVRPDAALRPAATVVVARDGAHARRPLEVLLLRRRLDSGFVPGAHVFPGGAVDPEDADLLLAGSAEAGTTGGVDAAGAAAMLELEDAALALSHWAAALRETFEECGALLARRPASDPPDPDGLLDPGDDAVLRARLAEHRAAVDAGRRSFASVLGAEGLVPAVDAVRYLGRWITPLGAPRRYDTRFFVAAAPAGQDLGPDGRETTELRWERPADALELHAAGELALILPTLRTLELLCGFATADALLEALPVSPAGHIELDEGGWRVPLRGEARTPLVAPWPPGTGLPVPDAPSAPTPIPGGRS